MDNNEFDKLFEQMQTNENKEAIKKAINLLGSKQENKFSPEVKRFINDLRHLSKKWYTLSMSNGGRESMFLDGYNAALLAARDDLDEVLTAYLTTKGYTEPPTEEAIGESLEELNDQ